MAPRDTHLTSKGLRAHDGETLTPPRATGQVLGTASPSPGPVLHSLLSARGLRRAARGQREGREGRRDGRKPTEAARHDGLPREPLLEARTEATGRSWLRQSGQGSGGQGWRGGRACRSTRSPDLGNPVSRALPP